jgi:hypothetical protein
VAELAERDGTYHVVRSASKKDKLTIGVFDGLDGFLYALVTNRDYRNPASPDLTFVTNGKDVAVMDERTGEFRDDAGHGRADGKVSVDLRPSGAKLFRWKSASPRNSD